MSEGDLYLKNNVEGMNNDQLILFIYQEMLKILNQTIYYFEKNDIENRVNGINKAIEVANALMSILNFEQGGDIAVRLRSLYLYSVKKLTAANLDQDPKPVEDVIKIFKDLYSGWAQKIEKDRENVAKASPITNSFQDQSPDTDGGSPGQGGLEIYG
ncbi:MAG: flagellar export chaperone FliS [bacterium]|nr:flagellar export chaperone FliS [bacterium]